MPSPSRFDLRPGLTEPVLLLISRQAIESGNVGVIAQRLRLLTASREDIWRYRSQVCLVIDGYQDDPRALVDVPQVRAFIRKLNKVWPYWAYFLNHVDESIKIYLSCLCGAAYPGGGAVEIDLELLKQTLLMGFNAMNGLYESNGFSEKELEMHSREVIQVLEQAGMA
jgi:hypothetical protein